MGANVILGTLAVTLGLCAATQSFAYLMRLDAALGAPLYREGWVALYGPWKIVQWVWWWGALAPSAFALPGMLGLLSLTLTVRQGWQGQQKKDEAHWATMRELKDAQCLGKRGVVLGLNRRRILCYTGGLHCFMVGRTGAGKSRGFMATIFEYPDSLLLKDPSNELWELTAGYRSTLGQVIRLAPTDDHSACYNPWEAIDIDSDDAYREVDILSHYHFEKQGVERESGAGIHFREIATQVLNGVSLFGLATGTATCGEDFNDLVHRTDWPGLCHALKAFAHPNAALESVVQIAGEVASRITGDELSGLQSTLARALSIYLDPRVARMTRTSSFPLAALRDGSQPCTVYWHAPFRDQARLRFLSRLVFHQMLDDATKKLQWRQRLGVVFEELPSLKYFPLANEGLNYFRKYGVQLLLITPSLQEAIKEYGPFHNLLVGTHVQAIYGLSDTDTAEKFVGRIGTHEVTHTRTTRQGGKTSITEEPRKEALLDATGITKLDEGQVLVLVGKHSVIATQPWNHRRRRWHHQAWNTKSRMPAPSVPSLRQEGTRADVPEPRAGSGRVAGPS